MSTVREFFDRDFGVLARDVPATLRGRDCDIELKWKVHFDFNSAAKFISVYIPEVPDLEGACTVTLDGTSTMLSAADGMTFSTGIAGEPMIASTSLVFSGRIFIYTAGQLSSDETSRVLARATKSGLILTIRGRDHALERSKNEKPLAFISHDSRDKESVARPLAHALQRGGCPVWYDEFSLKVGDSLRASIEQGLKESHRCILILSKHFLSNSGWTRIEFDSVFTRQIIQQERLILPVWVEVTAKQVYEYSPSLADLKALTWTGDVDTLARELHRAIGSVAGAKPTASLT